jgi:hypothetical protein
MRPTIRTRRPVRLIGAAATLAIIGLVVGSGAALASGPTPEGGKHIGATRGGHAKPVSLLIDHGGPVLPSSKTYLIFWGTFPSSASDLPGAMVNLFEGFNRSNYLAIAQQYMHGASISSTYGGSFADSSAPPSHAPTASVLGTEVASRTTPVANALYVVFTSNLPKVNYCAWHDKTTVNGVAIEVAYVPLQPAGCSPLGSVNLHANTYSETTQAAADSAAHEFMETVTDPQLNAWYDKSGFEVADKCEYDYQHVVSLGNRSTWQIQSEWSNATSRCEAG